MGINRWQQQFQYSLAKGLVTFRAKATIGATGAPTLVEASSEGIASIARSGTGAYTLTFDDLAYQFVDMNVVIETASEANYLQWHLADEAVSTNKDIDFVMHQAGTATDPQNGDVMFITVVVRKTDCK